MPPGKGSTSAPRPKAGDCSYNNTQLNGDRGKAGPGGFCSKSDGKTDHESAQPASAISVLKTVKSVIVDWSNTK